MGELVADFIQTLRHCAEARANAVVCAAHCEELADALSVLQEDGEVEPTQRGDEVAAKMRAYYDEHVGDPWKEGTADSLMLGLYNIAVRSAALSQEPSHDPQ